ncbi:hypothetical protein V5O48_006751 [Marasmius crinis-equi]|uniref:C2H2-type domain-containing protein n=1 Tax=Marasmius crinis-equi TaxID=585013 RepID=A0ABR3FIS7_9AGAR
MLPTADVPFQVQAWEERQQHEGLRGYPRSAIPDDEIKPRSFSRQPSETPMSYDSPMQLDEPTYPSSQFHSSAIVYPESSQRTAFQLEASPPYAAQRDSFAVATDIQSGSSSPPSERYPATQRDFSSRFTSPAPMDPQSMAVDDSVSMWSPQSNSNSYPASHHRLHNRSSPSAPSTASVQWSHQSSAPRYILSMQSDHADASASETSIPMRDDSWFPVQHSSSGASDATLAYSRGQISRNLPATTIEHALDECDASSEHESQSHFDFVLDDDEAPVGETVGIVKKKKKSKMHQCEICNKLFPRPSGLKTHMNTHYNLKPFTCEFPGCNRSFTVRSNARRHLRTHGVIPDSANSSSTDYVVNFDAPMVPESQTHQLQNVPQKIKWMPPSLSSFNNVGSLRSISEIEDSECEYDELELDDDPVMQQGTSQLTVPLAAVASSHHSGGEVGGHYEGRNSFSGAGAHTYHPTQVKPSPR